MAHTSIHDPEPTRRETYRDSMCGPWVDLVVAERGRSDSTVALAFGDPAQMRRLAKELIAGAHDLEDALRAQADDAESISITPPPDVRAAVLAAAGLEDEAVSA